MIRRKRDEMEVLADTLLEQALSTPPRITEHAFQIRLPSDYPKEPDFQLVDLAI